MRKKIIATGMALLAAVTLAACGKSPDVTSNAQGTKIGDTIKIGVDMELTGPVSAYGSAENKGIKLAVEEINKAGGVDGKKLELVTKDNKSDNAESSTAATNLAVQNQVNAIIGPATSGAVSAASLNAQKTGVPLLSPSGTQDDLTVDSTSGKEKAKRFVFRTTFRDSFQGQVLAQYAQENMQAKKVVLFYDNSSDYAKGIAD
ncbi:ABC transporter substrate-binding protein, partial [Streptococcus sobrinus]